MHFINYEKDAKLECEVSHTLCELIGQVVVSSFGLNRLHDDGDDFFAVIVLPLIDLSAYVYKTSLVLCLVIISIVRQRIFVDWVLSSRPVESWDVNFVHVLCS